MSALELTRQYHFSAGHRLASPTLSPAQMTAEFGSAFPVGKTFALKPFVSRKYDSLLKMRYVSTYA